MSNRGMGSGANLDGVGGDMGVDGSGDRGDRGHGRSGRDVGPDSDAGWDVGEGGLGDEDALWDDDGPMDQGGPMDRGRDSGDGRDVSDRGGDRLHRRASLSVSSGSPSGLNGSTPWAWASESTVASKSAVSHGTTTIPTAISTTIAAWSSPATAAERERHSAPNQRQNNRQFHHLVS